MLYQTQDRVHEGRPEWYSEIHLATSANGYDWIADPRISGYGGTSCVVEAPDGTLFIYYGTKMIDLYDGMDGEEFNWSRIDDLINALYERLLPRNRDPGG